MSRVVRAVVGVAAITAAVVAAPFTGGTSLAFLPGVVGTFGASLVLGAALETIAGRPGTSGSQRQGTSGNIRGTTEAHNVVFGKARTGGVIHALGTTGSDNEYVWFALANSITHPGGADGISRIWVDEIEVLESQMAVSTVTDTLGQPMLRYEVTAGRFAGLIRLNFRRGTATQGADPDLAAVGGLATDYARGTATTTVRLFRDVDDEEAFQVAFGGRIPVIAIELRGNRVYDPRLDSTAGGSGSHRVVDPTTWTWSDNAALCAATYSIMAQSDGGEGVLPADVDWFSVAASANVCDQVPAEGGKLYRCSALLTTANDRRGNTALLLDAMQGARVSVGTLYTFYAGAWRTPSFSVDETWLRGAAVISPRASLSSVYNQVRVSTLDAAQGYQKVEAPPYVNAAFEAQDGNRRLVRDVDFPTCADIMQAQRMAALLGRKSRRQMSIELPLNWRGMTIETWETGTVSLPGRDFAGRTFRIVSMEMTEEGPNVTLQEDAAADYGAIEPQEVPSAGTDPLVLATPPALTSLTATGVADGINLRWQATSAFRSARVVVARKPGAPEVAGTFVPIGSVFGSSYVDAVLDGSTYSYVVWTELANGTRGPNSNVASATAAINGLNPEFAETLEELIARLDVSTNPDGTLKAGSVSETQFANGIQPVGVVDVLPDPAGYIGPDVVLLTTDRKLYRYTGTGWTAEVPAVDLSGQITGVQIEDAALTFAKFSPGVQPIGSVSSLPDPVEYEGPLTVFLTSDRKLYRYTGAAWTAAVPTADLTGQIPGTQIVADSITANQIAAGTITSAELAAGTVSATRIFVGDLSNVLKDSEFQESTPGQPAVGYSSTITVLDASNPFASGLPKQRWAFTQVRDNVGPSWPVVPGEQFSVSGYVRPLAGQTSSFGLWVRWRNRAGGVITFSNSWLAPPSLSTWTLYNGLVTAPSDAAFADLYPLIDQPVGVSSVGWGFAAPVVRRAASGELIVDGAITANKIAANSVTADKIAANAVTADKIAANSISAAKIAANAVTAGKIAADAVTAGVIAAGAVSATQIAANAITTEKIAAGQVTTAKIVVGAASVSLSATSSGFFSTFPARTSSFTVRTPTVGFASTGTPRKIIATTQIVVGGFGSLGLPSTVAYILCAYGLSIGGVDQGAKLVTAIPVPRTGATAFYAEIPLPDVNLTSAPPAGTQQIGTYVQVALFNSSGSPQNTGASGAELLTRYTIVIEENKV